jgi:RNA polymerase sigma-70 factor (sigma-E family)
VVVEARTEAVVDDQLGTLYRAHYRDLVRLARLLVDDPATSEDVVQDAFARFGSRLHAVAPEKAPAYLRSMVLNGARSHLRHRQVRRRHPWPDADQAPAAEVGGLDRTRQLAVVEAVRRLPARQRAVLLLRFYLDLTEREVAETLGISVGSVKTHTRRGFAALAPLLEDLR